MDSFLSMKLRLKIVLSINVPYLDLQTKSTSGPYFDSVYNKCLQLSEPDFNFFEILVYSNFSVVGINLPEFSLSRLGMHLPYFLN